MSNVKAALACPKRRETVIGSMPAAIKGARVAMPQAVKFNVKAERSGHFAPHDAETVRRYRGALGDR